MNVKIAEYNQNLSFLRVAHLDFYIDQEGTYWCSPFTRGEVEFANMIAFEISKGRKELEEKVTDLEIRLTDLTEAIEDFLNDCRERPAVEKLEEAMNKLGMRK